MEKKNMTITVDAIPAFDAHDPGVKVAVPGDHTPVSELPYMPFVIASASTSRHPSVLGDHTIGNVDVGSADRIVNTSRGAIENNEEKRAGEIIARRHTFRVLSGFLVAFMAGWGDGVTGVVLPYMKQQFHLTYTLSALIFVAVSSGYVITAFTLERFTNYLGRFPLSSEHRLFLPPVHLSLLSLLRLPLSLISSANGNQWRNHKDLGFSHIQGRHFVMILATIIHTLFFVTTGSSWSFAGVLVGFFMNGFAKGNMISTMNAYMVAHPHTFGLGHMHSFYCIGALTSPLVCQTVIAKNSPWQRFYLFSVGLAAMNILSVTLSFRPAKEEFIKDREVARQLGLSVPMVRRGEDAPVVEAITTELGSSAKSTGQADSTGNLGSIESNTRVEEQASRHNLPRNMFMTAIKTPAVWAFSFFVSMYTGSEGVTSGYIVTYLLKTRNADPARVGYANSAFWAGAAVGRMLLGYTAPHMGRLKPYWIFVFLGLALTLHVCIWMIPSFIVGWALTAFVGLSMGPVFPLLLEIASRAVSPAVVGAALAILVSMANLGGAIYPFLTGLLSNAKGEKVIEPLIVTLLAVMFCFWAIAKVKFI
ncbi:MFS general substrate transporter [Serendipita vermifera]|nr:MFS general substrate transporter [Serendipita vermifera]